MKAITVNNRATTVRLTASPITRLSDRTVSVNQNEHTCAIHIAKCTFLAPWYGNPKPIYSRQRKFDIEELNQTWHRHRTFKNMQPVILAWPVSTLTDIDFDQNLIWRPSALTGIDLDRIQLEWLDLILIRSGLTHFLDWYLTFLQSRILSLV